MSSHLVAGVPLPDAVGGHPALDFCNTRAGWGSAQPKEYLTSPRALALWAIDAGVGPGPASPVPASPVSPSLGASALARALDLRESLYRCALRAGSASDWQLLSAEAAAARSASALVPDASGRAGWAIDPDADPALLALHAAAACAEALVTSSLVTCVAACPGVGCGWLFADPRRRRRWCSMAVCGNRAKARRHAERRR
jgi:predicted RNA-binding Zn ribbon-like protein